MKNINLIGLKIALFLHTFSYKLASRFAKKVENGGIHPKHRLMQYHSFFLTNVSKGDEVLDIGCGKGEVVYDVAQKAKLVVGIDNNQSFIAKAKRNYSASNITYLFGDARTDLGKRTFDVVILSNVLEHISDRVAFLESIRPLAKKFLIRVPMINRDWITLYKKELGLEWRLDNTHETEYTLEQLQEELRQSGFNLREYSIQFGEIWGVAMPEKNKHISDS